MIKVLIVDDSTGESILTRAALDGAVDDYQVEQATSADHAITKVATLSPDIILVDLCLCGYRDGLDLLPELSRATPAAIIIYTNAGREEDRLAAMEAGADGFQIKPNSVSEIRSFLLDAINKHVKEAA